MAIIEQLRNGDGSTLTGFTFTFPSYKVEDIKVAWFANDTWTDKTVTTHYTIVNYTPAGGGEVQFTSGNAPPSATGNVRIYRDTDVDTVKASYQAGSSITADDLNNNFKSGLYALQELKQENIDTNRLMDGAVTTAKIDPDAITGAKIADDSIDSEHYVDGSIDTAHIANDAVTTDKIADGTIQAGNIGANAITHGKMADSSVGTAEIISNTIDSQHYVDGSIDTEHYAANSVDTTALAADAVTGAQLADNAVDSEHITNGSVDLAHLAADSVNSSKIVDGSIVAGDIANATITGAKLVNDTITSTQIGANAVTASELADDAVDTAAIVNDAVDGTKIADNAIDSEHYTDGSIDRVHLEADIIDSTKLADNAVGTEHIADAELTTLASMQSGTASVLADSTALAATTTEINSVCENRAGETTITDSDAKIPTSGAVVDYVAAQIAPIGGLEVIADDESFPETQPAAGVVISIADAGGLVVNGSGTSTTGDTITSNATVTINNINSQFHSTTIAAGVGMQVSSTGSGQIYNYHKALLKEADLANLSNDINDFGNRYRVHAGEPGSNNDEGDLVYDTNADKMKVYDSSTSSWKEVTSTGDFKYLFLCPAGGTGAPTLTNTTFDLREGSNSGAAASVTNAAQLLVSINGVVQKANTGTSAPAEGFALVDANTIIFSAAPGAGASIFIHQAGSAVSIPTPGDNTVSTAKVQSNSLTEEKLAISNAGSNGQFLSKQSGNAGGLTWADVPAGVGGATGVDFNDDVEARWGTGDDLVIKHTSNESYIHNKTGDLNIVVWDSTASAWDEAIVVKADSAGVDIKHNAATKLATSATGVTVTGTVAATAYTGDGSALTGVASATADGCIYENDQTISNNYTIASGKGAHSVGPITVNATVTVNGNWVVS